MDDQPDIEDTIDSLLEEERDEDKDLINKLARLFYGVLGYHVEPGFDFTTSPHPQEKAMYDQASLAISFAREHFHIPEP